MKWRTLLWPLSLLYSSATGLRNLAFDRGLLPSQSFPLPVIAIGNLSTGGTGKTPMVEFILREAPEIRWGVVSRGYGRKTRGLFTPDAQSTADQMGDEPRQILSHFPNTPMALSEKRATGIEAIAGQCEAILLDDAYQHRHVQASSYLLLTTWKSPYFNDLVLPAGNLRESRSGRKRADAIVVTKCPPDLSAGLAHEFRDKLRVSAQQKVFFSSLSYEAAINPQREVLAVGSRVQLLSGIADPRYFEAEARQHFEVAGHWRFRDHHRFTAAELQKFRSQLEAGGRILTTAKDFTRLEGQLPPGLLQRVYYLPVAQEILFDEKPQFLALIRAAVSQFEDPGTS